MKLRSYLWGTSVLLILLASGSAVAQSRLEQAIAAANDHAGNLRPSEADGAFQDLLDRNPDSAEVLTAYGSFKRLWGEYGEAISMLQHAMELAPDDGGALFQLGLAYRFARRYGAAESVFRRVIGIAPTNATAWQHLAYTEIAQGDRAAALRHLQVAEHLFGDEAADWRYAQLAFGYAELGRRNDTQRTFEALTNAGSASQASLALGCIAMGNYEQALEHLEAAISDPEVVAGAANTLHQIRSNPFGDPALAGPLFQGVLSGLGHP